jgi:hypothetical protein
MSPTVVGYSSDLDSVCRSAHIQAVACELQRILVTAAVASHTLTRHFVGRTSFPSLSVLTFRLTNQTPCLYEPQIDIFLKRLIQNIPGKCWDSITLTRSPLPSRSFPINYLSIILPFGATVYLKTASYTGPQTWKWNLITDYNIYLSMR